MGVCVLSLGSLTSCDSFLAAFESKGLRHGAICPCASSPEATTASIRRCVILLQFVVNLVSDFLDVRLHNCIILFSFFIEITHILFILCSSNTAENEYFSLFSNPFCSLLYYSFVLAV